MLKHLNSYLERYQSHILTRNSDSDHVLATEKKDFWKLLSTVSMQFLMELIKQASVIFKFILWTAQWTQTTS
jgi:hypothetical protein